MPGPEVWKLRGFLHIADGIIKPLTTPPKRDHLGNKEFIRRVVWSMNQNEGFGIVEVFKEAMTIDPNSISLLPTAYEFESARPADSILSAINSNYR